MSTVAQRLPADRRFEFSSDACPADTFAVVRMSGVEAISKPYRFELVLVSDDAAIDFAKLVGAGAQLRILAPDDMTRATPYAGMLAEFDQLHQAGGFTFYRAVLVPRLWQLSLYRNSEVYLNEQTIPDIVEGLLAGARFSASRDYTLKLKGTYRPHSYVCQYQETPLDFVSRWLEREGIYYHFEQADGVERLVLLDDRSAQPAQALAVNYRPADEFDVGRAPDSVQAFVCRSRMLPRTLVLQDYNHRRASVPLEVQAEVSASGLGEEMLYGENFRSEEEGQRYATLRAEELRCGARVFSGEATAVGLRSGHFMDLSHHYREDFNGRYLVTEISHEGSQAGALLAGLKTPFNEGERETTRYRNSFVALPAATQFRPARTTPKPRVSGTMNATIDAEGSGEYAELDEHGQYKVQIPFDRTEKGAAKGSRPMRMASPYAGSDHGMHFPLHKGAEVLLSFIDGDPDRPVILGAVPNSANPNVVNQRNPHDNLISTKGGNQLRMSDTKGKEVIWLNSPFHNSSIGIGSIHPDGGGSIYEATVGGKDAVSFGNNNAMSFGSKNTLSLGTEASLAASFANRVTMGTSLSVNFATDIKWNMNAVPWSDMVKSVTIDDTDVVTLKKSFSSNALDSVTLTAGARTASAGQLALDTELNILRGAISGYTALNLAQSTVFGMAVNGSAGGVLTPEQKRADSSSPSQAGGFMGWPGIVTKFGTDAILNGVALVLIQERAQALASKIKALKNMSRMTLNDKGVIQTINEGADDVGRIALTPQTGIEMVGDEFSVVSRASANITAAQGVWLTSPHIFLANKTSSAYVWIHDSPEQVELGAAGSKLELKKGVVNLQSEAISIGNPSVPNPLHATLTLQKVAAREACDSAWRAYAAETIGTPGADMAFKALQSTVASLNAIQKQLTEVDPTLDVPVLNGLRVDNEKSLLSFLASSVKAAGDGVTIACGSAVFKVDAMGLSGTGPLIKLG